MDWNPRYVAYAKARGRIPEAQLEADRLEYPGGSMCGFILWIARNVRACPCATKDGRVWDQDGFTKFLVDSPVD